MSYAGSGHAETLDVPVSGGDGADHTVCDWVAVILERCKSIELRGSVLFFGGIFDCIFQFRIESFE